MGNENKRMNTMIEGIHVAPTYVNTICDSNESTRALCALYTGNINVIYFHIFQSECATRPFVRQCMLGLV